MLCLLMLENVKRLSPAFPTLLLQHMTLCDKSHIISLESRGVNFLNQDHIFIFSVFAHKVPYDNVIN